jgi:hypothetical protein
VWLHANMYLRDHSSVLGICQYRMHVCLVNNRHHARFEYLSSSIHNYLCTFPGHLFLNKQFQYMSSAKHFYDNFACVLHRQKHCGESSCFCNKRVQLYGSIFSGYSISKFGIGNRLNCFLVDERSYTSCRRVYSRYYGNFWFVLHNF